MLRVGTLFNEQKWAFFDFRFDSVFFLCYTIFRDGQLVDKMKKYLATITIDDPFPKKFDYRVEGSSLAVAGAKALLVFRKELKGRRLKQIKLLLTFYGTETPLSVQ